MAAQKAAACLAARLRYSFGGNALRLAPGRVKSGHGVIAHLQRSHHITRGAGILRSGEDPDLIQVVSLAAGAGPGLGVSGCIEMPATGAPEYYEH